MKLKHLLLSLEVAEIYNQLKRPLMKGANACAVGSLFIYYTENKRIRTKLSRKRRIRENYGILR